MRVLPSSMRGRLRAPALPSAVPLSLIVLSLSCSSGRLVIKDHNETIVLRTRHILIDGGGELHAGSTLCPFQGSFRIVLYGRCVCSFQGSGAALGSDGKEAFKGERRARPQASVQDRVINVCCHVVVMNEVDVSNEGEALCCSLGLHLAYRSPASLSPTPSPVMAQGGSVSIYVISYNGQDKETFLWPCSCIKQLRVLVSGRQEDKVRADSAGPGDSTCDPTRRASVQTNAVCLLASQPRWGLAQGEPGVRPFVLSLCDRECG